MATYGLRHSKELKSQAEEFEEYERNGGKDVGDLIADVAANTVAENAHGKYYSSVGAKQWITRIWKYIRSNRAISFLLLITMIDVTAAIVGSVARMITNSMQVYPSYTLYFLNVLMIVTSIAMIYFVVEALRHENAFQLVSFILLSLFLTGRMCYNVFSVVSQMMKQAPGVKGILISIITVFIPAIVVFICQIALFIAIIPVFRSFGWKVYRKVGASPELIYCYRCYSIYVSILKLDAFIIISLMVMGGFFLKFDYWYSYVFFTLATVFSFLASMVSVYIGCKREFISVQILFAISAMCLPTYLVYKLVDLWVDDNAIKRPKHLMTDDQELRVILTLMILMSVFWRLLLLSMIIVVTSNFHKGLRPIFTHERGLTIWNKITELFGFKVKSKMPASLAENLIN